MSARGALMPPRDALLAEALDRALQALAQRSLGLEADQLAGPGDVEVARRLAVGPRGVPDDLALEADELLDRLGEVADARLDARCRCSPGRSGRGARRRGAARGRRRRRRGTRATAEPVPQSVTGSSPRSWASTNLRIIAAITCESSRSKLSSGPVEVGHDRGAGVEAVLAPVGVGEHEHHLLGQAVGRVGLLGVAVPERRPPRTAPA